MEDMTDKFVENPVEFLTTTPLIVQVPPESEFGGQPVRFTVKTYPSHNPRRPDKIPCQLQHDPGPQSSLLAYWCRYAADKPISLQLAEEANFMFTANMDGCSFTRSEKREGGSYLVCHSNAGNIAATLNEYAQNRGASSLVQKGMQKCMATKVVGTPSVTVHSFSQYNTTLVGIRSSGSWCFYKQVNLVEWSPERVSVKTMTKF